MIWFAAGIGAYLTAAMATFITLCIWTEEDGYRVDTVLPQMLGLAFFWPVGLPMATLFRRDWKDGQ